MWRASRETISPSESRTAMVRGPTRTHSGCWTGYSRPSEVRIMKGLKPPPETRFLMLWMFMGEA